MTPFRALGGAVLLACTGVANAEAEDKIDHLLRGALPPDMIQAHGYSDFTDPLGRFLDLLAAGAFDEARSIRPAACAAWAATRHSSAFSGKFIIWNTATDLDSICSGP